MRFVVVLLIGSGWSLLKPYLNDKEKRIVLVVLALQVQLLLWPVWLCVCGLWLGFGWAVYVRIDLMALTPPPKNTQQTPTNR